MRSNYKRLGDYIRQVNERNANISVTDLQGINIAKEFMPSVANVIGTDLTTYKIVRKRQFAFNPMHVGRDGVLPINVLLNKDRIIVSPAYTVLEIIDENGLNAEYLMMWFRRSEFDRNAWFTTDSSVRGGFGWTDFCDMKLPIPSIDKQKEIIKEYNILANRITLNNQLNQKLEETAQAIYKQWFVDFEFPDENGKPYKSNGGEMVESEMGEIPKGWKVKPFTEVVVLGGGGTPDTSDDTYWDGKIPFFTPADTSSSYYCVSTEKYITKQGLSKCSSKLYPQNTTFVTARGTVGLIAIAGLEMSMNQSCYAITGKNGMNEYYIHQFTINAVNKLKNEASGAVFSALVTRDFDSQFVVEPKAEVIYSFGSLAKALYSLILNIEKQNNKILSFQDLVLSKIATQITEP